MGGSDQDEVATININIVPTCFTCLDSMNSPAYFPIFRVDGLLIALNDGVYTLQYGLIVTNFDSLSPQLQEGGNYQISCFQQSLFRDVYISKECYCKYYFLYTPCLISSIHSPIHHICFHLFTIVM